MLKELRDKKFLATIQNSEAQALEAQVASLRQQLDSYCARCPCGREARPAPMECVGPRQSVIGLVTSSADRTRIYTEFFLKELRAVVDDLSRMPGIRVMVLISDGFNLVPGRELFGVMRAYFPNDDRWQMNDRDTSSQLEPILRAAAANNIVVYGLSSSGLALAGGSSAYQASSGAGAGRQGVGQIALPEINRQASQVRPWPTPPAGCLSRTATICWPVSTRLSTRRAIIMFLGTRLRTPRWTANNCRQAELSCVLETDEPRASESG